MVGNTDTHRPTSGQYKDMPAQRRFLVALPCQKAPLSVTCQGRKLLFSYDGQNLETTIDLGAVNCSAGIAVTIEMPESAEIVDGTKAHFRHIQTAVKEFKQHDAGMVYTEDFGFLEAAPLRLSYHPENQEETLAAFKEKFNRIKDVLIEQMGDGDNYRRTLRLLGL